MRKDFLEGMQAEGERKFYFYVPAWTGSSALARSFGLEMFFSSVLHYVPRVKRLIRLSGIPW